MAKKPVAKDKKGEGKSRKLPVKGLLSGVSLIGIIASSTIVFGALHDMHLGDLQHTFEGLALPAFATGIVSLLILFFTSRPGKPAEEPAEQQQAPSTAEFEQKLAAALARVEKLESSAFEMLGAEFAALKEANERLNGVIEQNKKVEQERIEDELAALRAENAKLKEMLHGPENAAPLQVA